MKLAKTDLTIFQSAQGSEPIDIVLAIQSSNTDFASTLSQAKTETIGGVCRLQTFQNRRSREWCNCPVREGGSNNRLSGSVWASRRSAVGAASDQSKAMEEDGKPLRSGAHEEDSFRLPAERGFDTF